MSKVQEQLARVKALGWEVNEVDLTVGGILCSDVAATIHPRHKQFELSTALSEEQKERVIGAIYAGIVLDKLPVVPDHPGVEALAANEEFCRQQGVTAEDLDMLRDSILVPVQWLLAEDLEHPCDWNAALRARRGEAPE